MKVSTDDDRTGGQPDRVPPLDETWIRALLEENGARVPRLDVRERTTSTNTNLAEAAKAEDIPEGAVVVAATQSAGRGRLGRLWESPPGTLSFSILLKPPVAAMPFASFVVALAVAEAIQATSGVSAALKWPNDVVSGAGKLSGLLAERAGDGVVVGCGVNVGVPAADLDVPGASSLADLGGDVSREELLVACVGRIQRLTSVWSDASYSATASGLLDRYRGNCVTLGQSVVVMLPDDTEVRGQAKDVDESGRLLVTTSSGEVAVDAGDVVQARTDA